MSCCTKDNTKEKIKDEKASGCGVGQTENLKSTSEHSAEDCTGESCKIHRGAESEQKSDSESCCD